MLANIKRWKLLEIVENTLKSGALLKLIPRNRRFIMHKIKKNPKLRAVKFMTELEKRFIIKLNLKAVR